MAMDEAGTAGVEAPPLGLLDRGPTEDRLERQPERRLCRAIAADLQRLADPDHNALAVQEATGLRDGVVPGTRCVLQHRERHVARLDDRGTRRVRPPAGVARQRLRGSRRRKDHGQHPDPHHQTKTRKRVAAVPYSRVGSGGSSYGWEMHGCGRMKPGRREPAAEKRQDVRGGGVAQATLSRRQRVDEATLPDTQCGKR
jgi:hypothetical protein